VIPNFSNNNMRIVFSIGAFNLLSAAVQSVVLESFPVLTNNIIRSW
jgi:hypothetical protein